jgi:S1-C subfamily serine protease
VIAIGYPNQGMTRLRPRALRGTLLARGQHQDGPPMLAFRAGLRPGDSGGPLLDRQGRVAGLVVAEVNAPEVFREEGILPRDVGFAYQATMVRDLLARHGQRLPADAGTVDAGSARSGPELEQSKQRAVRVICQLSARPRDD